MTGVAGNANSNVVHWKLPPDTIGEFPKERGERQKDEQSLQLATPTYVYMVTTSPPIHDDHNLEQHCPLASPTRTLPGRPLAEQRR